MAKLFAIRFARLGREGFSEQECEWYGRRRIGTRNVRRLRRLRRKFISDMTEGELTAFHAMMDDYISNRARRREELEVNIFSPAHEDIDDVIWLWTGIMEGRIRIEPKRIRQL